MIIPENIYPFKGHIFRINGHSYHYLDEGKGDTVVMVHGNPTWSIYFRRLVSELRGSFRTIVPDHIGCGFSGKPRDDEYDYTLSSRINDLESLLDHLEIDRNITLVLHDWGGMIGMGYATRHPERIKKIVLLNTAAFHIPATKKFPYLLYLCRDTYIGKILVSRFNAFSRIAGYICCKRKPLDKNLRSAYSAPYRENPIATLKFVQDIPLKPGDRAYDLVTSIQDRLKLFENLPVLICWGMKDFVFDHHFLHEWKNIYLNAEIHEFHDCGHYILEDADNEVTALIKKFLGIS